MLVRPGLLELREVPRPDPLPGGALIAVKACGVCSSDVRMATQGHPALVCPRILGHEVVGVVAKSRHPGLREGTLVQVAPALRCGRCRACRAGRENRCPEVGILGFTHDGGMAELLFLPLEGSPRGNLNPLPSGLPPEEAVLAEPLACCLNAQELVGLREGERVLIVGGGPMGCLHALLARWRGAEVELVEPLEHRQRLARATGARVLPPHELFEGEGRVDVLILASSEVALDERLLRLLAPGGRVSLFSGLSPGTALHDLNVLHYREISLMGAYGCTASQCARALELLAELRPAWLITRRLPLEGFGEALEHVRSRRGMKAVLLVGEPDG